MPDAPKPGILRNLRIKRVALVDMGANTDPVTGDGAHIMLWKRAPVEKDGPNLTQVHVDTISGDDKKRLKPEAADKKEKAVAKTISGFLKGLLGVVAEADPTIRATKAAELEKAFPDDVEKVAHDPDDAMCKCADCMAKAAPPEMAKALGDMRKQITDMEKANRALVESNDRVTKALQVEIDKRADAEITTLLKSFKAVPVNLEADVAIYRKMRDQNPEMFERQMTIMKATDALLADSMLLKNFGTGRVGEGSAWAQIEAKANAMVEKGNGSMTHEQALEKVMMENQHLVAKHREEQN